MTRPTWNPKDFLSKGYTFVITENEFGMVSGVAVNGAVQIELTKVQCQWVKESTLVVAGFIGTYTDSEGVQQTKWAYA